MLRSINQGSNSLLGFQELQLETTVELRDLKWEMMGRGLRYNFPLAGRGMKTSPMTHLIYK